MTDNSTFGVPACVAAEAPRNDVLAPIPTGVLIANLAAVILPFLGLAAVAISLWGWGFSWIEFGLLLGMYALSAVGITVGYHRLFTHRSFKTTRALRALLAVLGSMATAARWAWRSPEPTTWSRNC